MAIAKSRGGNLMEVSFDSDLIASHSPLWKSLSSQAGTRALASGRPAQDVQEMAR
jgi:hypothetical protein